MGEHAQLSPSAAHRWLTCPASVKESATLVSADNAASLEGTAAHEVLNLMLQGETPVVGGKTSGGQVVTAEMVAAATEALRYVKQYIGDAPHTLMSEEKVEIGAAFGLPEGVCYGTCDIAVMRGDELLIADFKNGYQSVHAEENPQLILYAIGFMESLGWMYDTIRLVIIQPKDGAPKEWVLGKVALLNWLAVLTPSLKAALLEDASYLPTEDGCRYCPASGVCKALQDQTLALARQEFSMDSRLTRISPEELSEILAKADIIETALAAAREHALKIIQLGQTVPGWKVVEGRKNRVWKDEERAIAAFRLFGCNEEEFAPRKMLTPAKAEKLLKNEQVMADLIETPAGSPVLARESDKRPALTTMNHVDFGNLLD
jgi:hypothetical protein